MRLAVLEREAQRAVGLRVAGEDDDPGRVAVDAVDDPQPRAELPLEPLLQAQLRRLAAGRDHRLAGRLVGRDDVVVLVQQRLDAHGPRLPPTSRATAHAWGHGARRAPTRCVQRLSTGFGFAAVVRTAAGFGDQNAGSFARTSFVT